MAKNGENVESEKVKLEENNITGKENIDLSRDNNSLKETNPKLESSMDNNEEIAVIHDKFIEPFKHGWLREVVERATALRGKRMCDVYYRSPDGTKKLRSIPDVINYLNSMEDTKGLTSENFTFYKKVIYREPFEMIRKAKERPSNKLKLPEQGNKSPGTSKYKTYSKIAGFKKKSPSRANVSSPKSLVLKRNLFPKQNLSLNDVERHLLPRAFVPITPIDIDSKRTLIRKTAGKNAHSVSKLRLARPFSYSQKRNSSSGAGSICKKLKNNGIDETEIQLCSERCAGALGQLPSLQCSICLCLFHPSCTDYSETSSVSFTCKRCCDSVKNALQDKLKNLMKTDNESSSKTDESLTDDEGLANICALSPEVVLQHEGSDQDDVVVLNDSQNRNPPYVSDSKIQNPYWNAGGLSVLRQMPPLRPASQLTQQPRIIGKKISVASTFYPPCIPNNSQIRILAVQTSNMRMPLNQQVSNPTNTPQPPPLRLPHTNVIETSKLSAISPNRFVVPATINTRATRPLILQKNSNQCLVLAPQNNILCTGSNQRILGPFSASSLPQILAIGNKLVCITSSNQPVVNTKAPIISVTTPQVTTQGPSINSKPIVNIPVINEAKLPTAGEVPSRLSTLLINPSVNENPYKVQTDLFKSKLDVPLTSIISTTKNEVVNKTIQTSGEAIDSSVTLTIKKTTNETPDVPTVSNSGKTVIFSPYNLSSPYNNTVITTIAKMETTTTPAITSPMTTSRVTSEVLTQPTIPTTPVTHHLLPLNPLPPLQIFTSDVSQFKLDIAKCNQNIIKSLLSPSKSISCSAWQEESPSNASVSGTKELHLKQEKQSESVNKEKQLEPPNPELQDKYSEAKMVELQECSELETEKLQEHSESKIAELHGISESETVELQERQCSVIRKNPNVIFHQKNYSYFSGLNTMTACYSCLNIIFSHLDIIDLLRCRLVCKTWHTLASQPFLWKSICLNNLCITNWKRFAVAVGIHSTKYLDMKGMKSKGKPYDMWREFVNYLNYFENITYLELGQAPTFVLYGIAEILLNLKTLKAECIQLGKRDPPNCSINFSLLKKLLKLEFLQLRAVDGFATQNNNYGLMPLQRFTKLRYLSITTLRNVESEHFRFLENLKLLEVLEIGDCYDWKSENFLCLGNLTKLQKLRIEKAESIEGLVESLSNLNLLEKLYLVCCKIPPLLGPALLKLNNLKFFSIWPDTSSCASVVNSNTLQAVTSLKTLQELHWVILTADGAPDEPSNKEKLEECAECQIDFENTSLSLPFEDESCKKLKEAKKSAISHLSICELRDRLNEELPSTNIRFFRVPLMLMDKYCALK